ncbi:MAG: response regulator transcription factor [Balneolaceae bacterium]
MNKPISLLLADDHSLIRSGLKQVLAEEGNFDISEVDNGVKAIKHIRENDPKIAILDIEMPGMTGFEVAKAVYHEGIHVDIIFLTMFKDDSMFNQAMNIGVKGYVLKENTVSEIVQCVNAVLAGKTYLSPAISDFLIRRNNKLMARASDKDGLNCLTPSEMTILKKLSEMKTSQEIADELNVSIKTVQNHRNNICNKLDLSGTHALLKFSVEHSHQI